MQSNPYNQPSPDNSSWNGSIEAMRIGNDASSTMADGQFSQSIPPPSFQAYAPGSMYPVNAVATQIANSVSLALCNQQQTLNGLYTEIQQRDAAIGNLKLQLSKATKPEVIKTYSITEDKSHKRLLYHVIKNSGVAQAYNSAVFADFIVSSFTILQFNPLYELENHLMLTLSNGTTAIIPLKKLKPSSIINEMSKYNAVFFLDRSVDTIGQIFISYLSSHLNTATVMNIPYTPGWLVEAGKKPIYLVGNGSCKDIISPYFQNKFNISEGTDISYCISESLEMYRNFFLDEATRVIMLSSVGYSVLFSLYKQLYGLKVNKVLLLSSAGCSVSLQERTADMFLKLFDTRGFESLNKSKKELERMLTCNKDAMLILGGQINSYNAQKNAVSYIKDYFINSISLTIKGIAYEAECMLACIGSELEYKLDSDEFISIYIDSTNTNSSVINNFSLCKQQWQAMIKGFIDYIERNVDSLNPYDLEVSYELCDTDRDAYILLAQSLRLFKGYARSYNIDFDSTLGLSDDCFKLLAEYLNRENEDADSISKLFTETIHDLVAKGILHEKYNNIFTNDEDVTNIYLIDDEVWIRFQLIHKEIVPAMCVSINSRQVLNILKNVGTIRPHGKTNEWKRPIKNAPNSQETFVILNRDYYKPQSVAHSDIEIFDPISTGSNLWGNDPFMYN
jgi:hypothetical protein